MGNLKIYCRTHHERNKTDTLLFKVGVYSYQNNFKKLFSEGF